MDELPIPSHYQSAAEQIRAHLCHLRGGAPFLSSQDALTLVQWLDGGVPVADVLVALERAADARRRARSRFPLSLTAAKRHLGRGHAARVRSAAAGEPRFGPLLDGVPGGDTLRDALTAAEDEAGAVAAVRAFLDTRWAALSEGDRSALEHAARADLGDLLALVDEDTAHELVAETARDLFRQRWPQLTAAAIRDLARAG